MRRTSKNEQELARETRGSGEFFPGKTSGTETGYSIQQSPLLWVSDLYLLNITGYCSWLISNKSFFMFLPFYFWPHLEACRIFEAMPWTVKAWHPKHWNSERNLKAIRCKASVFFFLPSFFFFKNCLVYRPSIAQRKNCFTLHLWPFLIRLIHLEKDIKSPHSH